LPTLRFSFSAERLEEWT